MSHRLSPYSRTAAVAALGLSLGLAPTYAVAAPAEASAEGERTATPEQQQQAQALRTEAEQAFFDGDYDTAIATFKQAFDLSPHSTDLFNLGRIHEEMGDLQTALGYYEQFAERPRLSLEQRRVAAERIEVLRKIVEDPQRDAGTSSPPPPVMQPAYPPGYGDTGEEPDNGRPLVITGGVLAGVGASLAIAGGVGFGLVAQRNAERVNMLAGGDNPNRLTLSEAEDLHTQGRNAEVLQITFIATGGTVALIGGALLATGLVKRNRNRNLAVAPALGPGLLGAHARWHF